MIQTTKAAPGQRPGPAGRIRRKSAGLVTLVLAGCAGAGRPGTAPAPDLGKRIEAEHAVVTSAHPLASAAGVEMLERGGNAVDAAVATAFAVSVGEPQMSGLGGGGSALVWLEDAGRAEYLDFYSSQRVPSFAGLEADESAWLRGSAIPGAVAGLLALHEGFGTLPREVVMAPAIRMAEEGVPVNQILAQMIQQDSAKLWRDADARAAFWPDGRPLTPGQTLRLPELAESLRRVAREGRDGFYRGDTAERVVAQLNDGGHPASLPDLVGYEPRWVRPLCGEYRGLVVLSAPPPQTGMQVLHTLELLEPYDLRSMGLPTRSARAFDVLTSALRVGMAGRMVSDPRWVDVPAAGVSSPRFAAARADLIGTGTASDSIRAADPRPFDHDPPTAACRALDPYGSGTAALAGGETPASGERPAGGETTHISVVDARGNAVALTQTNSSLFGSGAHVAGFFINDSGIDFSSSPAMAEDGRGEWRTRSSTISPTIVLRGDEVEMVVGAPGGGRIPTAIAQNMVYTLDYGLDPLEALRMPRIFPAAADPGVQLENGFDAETLRQAREMGYRPASLSFGYARLYMIVRRDGRWVGVADPRHDGGVSGY